MSASQAKENKCSQCGNLLEVSCLTCKKSICDSKHTCVTEVIKEAQQIKDKLEIKLDSVVKEQSNFQYHIAVCKTAIDVQEMAIIKKVKEKSNQLKLELDNSYREKEEDIYRQLKNLDLIRDEIKRLIESASSLMNKPEEIETLVSHRTRIAAVREIIDIDIEKSFKAGHIYLTFIPSTHLDEIDIGLFGEIITVNAMYNVAGDESITVLQGQPFVVNVTSLTKTDTCQLAVILKNSSGEEESVTEVEYQRSGEYRITGRCNAEGDWKMKITNAFAQIKGSPVNIKVERLGLVHTTGNISDYKQKTKTNKVTDVVVDEDGCLLVSSGSKQVLKFNQLGSFVTRIAVPQHVMVNRMHLLSNGYMAYGDYLHKCIVMCDDTFQETFSFGKGILKYPLGLAVNKNTSVLYVADREAHCVFKFSIDDGRLLGRIGSKGSGEGQLKEPYDVTLTTNGHVIVTDFGNSRIQMFDANDNFMRVIVGSGKADGGVSGPCGVTVDTDGHLIVSSNHKLQLFEENGVFIKRIDNNDDGLDVPCGIAVIRHRRVAVANNTVNNVKIFNY